LGDAGCAGADSFGAGATVPAAAAQAYANWGSPTPTTSLASLRPTIAPSVSRTVPPAPSACTTSPATGRAAAINSTLSGRAENPSGGPSLLYFPRRVYYLDAPVDVPAGADVVIAGDGPFSRFVWTGSAPDAAVFHAHAPSKAMFRDLRIWAEAPGSR